MPILKIDHSVNPNDIYAHVTCLDCDNSFRAHLRGAETRKPCPFCSTGLFYFEASGVRGGVEVQAYFVGESNRYKRTSYPLKSQDIELDES